MDQDLFSCRVLLALCKSGDVESVQTFLEKTLPSLPQERQASFCHHSRSAADSPACGDVPCTTRIVRLSEAAVQGGQADVFAYLWDTFLGPRGITTISWPCLWTAASQGALPLAQNFHARDPHCFNRFEEQQTVHPQGVKRISQIEVAIRNDRFEYLDFMFAHGADINAKIPGKDLLRMVVRCAAENATTLQRLRFLASRGASAADSAALREVVAANCVELAACLLDSGAKVNDDATSPEGTSCLMLAASMGYLDMVQLLLDRGAKTDIVDREGKDAVTHAREHGHDSIAKLLQASAYKR